MTILVFFNEVLILFSHGYFFPSQLVLWINGFLRKIPISPVTPQGYPPWKVALVEQCLATVEPTFIPQGNAKGSRIKGILTDFPGGY